MDTTLRDTNKEAISRILVCPDRAALPFDLPLVSRCRSSLCTRSLSHYRKWSVQQGYTGPGHHKSFSLVVCALGSLSVDAMAVLTWAIHGTVGSGSAWR